MRFWRRDSVREVDCRAGAGKSGGRKNTGTGSADEGAKRRLQPKKPPPESPTTVTALDSETGSHSNAEHLSAPREHFREINQHGAQAAQDVQRDSHPEEQQQQRQQQPTVQQAAAEPALEDWEIDPSQLSVCRKADGKPHVLGAGSFGKVLKAIWTKSDGEEVEVAMKLTIISPEAARRRSLCDRLEADFIREIALMKFLCSRDTHMVPFHGACVYEGRLCLVLEFMPGGDLMDAIRGPPTGRYGWFAGGRSVALDIIRGLEFLHSHRVVHCDVKSKNILLNKDGEAKISDVGLSKMIIAGARGQRGTSVDTAFGTFAWAAPEMLMGDDATPAADVYSFGVVLWELCTQEVPKRGGRRDPVPQEAPLEVAAVIHACLRFDPAQRPSAKEVTVMLETASTTPPADQLRFCCSSDGGSYRACIEDSARRLHDGSFVHQYNSRPSVDVRRADELHSMEQSMQALRSRTSSGLQNAASSESPLPTVQLAVDHPPPPNSTADHNCGNTSGSGSGNRLAASVSRKSGHSSSIVHGDSARRPSFGVPTVTEEVAAMTINGVSADEANQSQRPQAPMSPFALAAFVPLSSGIEDLAGEPPAGVKRTASTPAPRVSSAGSGNADSMYSIFATATPQQLEDSFATASPSFAPGAPRVSLADGFASAAARLDGDFAPPSPCPSRDCASAAPRLSGDFDSAAPRRDGDCSRVGGPMRLGSSFVRRSEPGQILPSRAGSQPEAGLGQPLRLQEAALAMKRADSAHACIVSRPAPNPFAFGSSLYSSSDLYSSLTVAVAPAAPPPAATKSSSTRDIDAPQDAAGSSRDMADAQVNATAAASLYSSIFNISADSCKRDGVDSLPPVQEHADAFGPKRESRVGVSAAQRQAWESAMALHNPFAAAANRPQSPAS